MDLVERFKQCNIDSVLFVRKDRPRGEKHPSEEEKKQIAKAVSDYLDEAGAEIRINLVEALVKAHGVYKPYTTYPHIQEWFGRQTNPYLRIFHKIQTKTLKQAVEDYAKSRSLDTGFDDIELTCSVAVSSRIHYKDEEKLNEYLSKKLEETTKILKFRLRN